jgi:uncharacterized protein (DUF2252 family)
LNVSPKFPSVERADLLEASRIEKMSRSSHAFVRGNTKQHYEWLERHERSIPKGPSVWICGDCHVGNLGPIADRDGQVDVQIRDLDQTVIGSPAHDLIRLSLSLGSLARSSDLPGTVTAHMIEQVIEGYEAGLTASGNETPAKEPAQVRTVRRLALGRKWRHLARERIADTRPTIPLGKKFLELSDDERWNVGVLLDLPQVKHLILSLNRRSDEAKVELVDAAYWVKGCSSLGQIRLAALVHVSGDRKDKLSLIDIKEAAPSVAPSTDPIGMPDDPAERVVAGARALSPNLGGRMAAADFMGHSVVVRELLPEDLKLEIEQFSRQEAVGAARYLASVVGKAHGRQMGPHDRQGWINELQSRHPKELAAPSWLWTVVADLLGRHEQAYLEHCRLQLSNAA